MEPLKNMYTEQLLVEFAAQTAEVYPAFDRQGFLEAVMDQSWDTRELKARYRHISQALGAKLPADYAAAVAILRQLRSSFSGFPYIFFPDFIEQFGQAPEHWELSLQALKEFTSMNSSEFAIRPFIEQCPDRMFEVLLQWTEDDNEHVRRLASEGCRPRLPWASPLSFLKQDPSRILPILEKLKADESEYVRRSVANNLNDISKDHPKLVLELAAAWLSDPDPRTYWIVKHGCRTLLKQGDEQALRLFGFAAGDNERVDLAGSVQILDLRACPEDIRIGEELELTFRLTSAEPVSFKLQLAVHYIKANGTASPKRFHLTEKRNFAGELVFSRRVSFRELSTRKHYPGDHRMAVLVNGLEAAAIHVQVKSRDLD